MSNQMFKTCIIDGQEQYSFARSSKNGQAIETISQAFPEGLLSFLNLDMDELEPLFSAMTGQLRSWADTEEKEYVKEFLRSLDTLAQQHIYFELFNIEWTSRIQETQPADILRRQWRKCRVADMPKELRGMQQQIKDLFTHVLDYDRGHGSVTEKAAEYYRQMNGAAFLFRPLFLHFEFWDNHILAEVLYPESICDLISYHLQECVRNELRLRVCRNCGRYFHMSGRNTAILNKALNNKMVSPDTIFIDGTHIKASANKKKFQKEKVAQTAKVYSEQLRREVNAEREKLGKKPIKDEEDENDENTPHGGNGSGGMTEKTVSTTDPDCGMFVKGEHERQFAYEAHTACDRHGFILGVEVTAGNVHDSVAWDALYDKVTEQFTVQFVAMDAGYKTPWIAKKTFDTGKIPVLPYTRPHGRKEGFHPWDYEYDPVTDTFTCPKGKTLRHTTTDREGKRTYRSTPKECVNCPVKCSYCGANEKGQKILTTHIWQEYLDMVEAIRKTKRGKAIYAQRKETIERVFADAKEKHAMRYTHHRGLAAVTRWVRLKYAAMNLKKLAEWSWRNSVLNLIFSISTVFKVKPPLSFEKSGGSLTACRGCCHYGQHPLFAGTACLVL